MTATPTAQIDGLLSAAGALLPTDPGRALRLWQDAQALAQDADPRRRAQALLGAGQTLHRLAQLAQAREALAEASETFRQCGDAAGEVASLVTLGKVARELGERAAAANALDRALALSRDNKDLAQEADILNQQAVLQLMGGAGEMALALFSQALTLRERLGDDAGRSQVLMNIGQAHLTREEHGEALTVLGRAYEVLVGLDDPYLLSQCLMSIAQVYEGIEDEKQAYSHHRRAYDVAKNSGNRLAELYALNNLAGATLALGQAAEARELCSRALALAEQVGQRYLAGCIHHTLGQALLALGEIGPALRHHEQALQIATELEDAQSELDARVGLGEVHLRRGEVFRAAEQLELALPSAEQAGHLRLQARIHGLLAEASERSGDLRGAIGHLRAQGELAQKLATEGRERQTRQLTVQFDVERAHHEAEVERLRSEEAQRASARAEAQVEQRTRDLARSQVEVLARLANAAEYRDDVTGEHTLRVGQVAALIAERLGRPADEVALLRLAARLHDVGKIGISDMILLKPDRLTPEEFGRMKEHTRIGGQILSGGNSRLLHMAQEIALGHHEHWSGGGYPQGLAGEDIPMSARIVAVADVYDALSHQRPYKRPWTVPEVLAELRRQSGRQFQPEVVAALDALHADGTLPLRALPAEDDAPDVLAVLGALPGQEGESDAATRHHLRRLQARYDQAREEIRALQITAFSDALTGLGNRRAFEADLESALLQAERQGEALSVLSLDLDGLKRTNDTEGHERGDALLVAVAHALGAGLAPHGRLYRVGGDEFALLALGAGEGAWPELRGAVARGIEEVRRSGFAGAALSLGLASYPDDALDQGDIVRLSDQRMYEQKFKRRAPRRLALN